MAGKDQFTLRWGIMATGGIADLFARDLLKDPATRNVNDVAHTVQAVASSSSLEKAKHFADQITEGKPHSIASYGSYKELVEDPNVDIIYVATPHSHHYECSLLALRAGKNVCCEVCFPRRSVLRKSKVNPDHRACRNHSPSTPSRPSISLKWHARRICS